MASHGSAPSQNKQPKDMNNLRNTQKNMICPKRGMASAAIILLKDEELCRRGQASVMQRFVWENVIRSFLLPYWLPQLLAQLRGLVSETENGSTRKIGGEFHVFRHILEIGNTRADKGLVMVYDMFH